MKRQVLFVLSVLSSAVALQAQTDTPQDSVQLKEVVVKGARIVNRVDGKLIFPSDEVRKASTSGYNFLKRLALPGIKVDDISETVSGNELLGQVQVRINDVAATQSDLQSLQPQSVERVEYIDRPGARYGEGVGFVINIIVRRPTAGYVAGAGGTWMPRADMSRWNVYTKSNFGKSELSLSYSGNYSYTDGALDSETADYLMSGNTHYKVERNTVGSLRRSSGHDVQLRYSNVDKDRHVLLATVGLSSDRTPRDYSRKSSLAPGGKGFDIQSDSKDKSLAPVLDLYWSMSLGKTQAVKANATGSFVHTDYDSWLDTGGSLFAYSVAGKTWALRSEAMYENRLKPFTLTAGMRYNQKYVNNTYSGDAVALTRMHISDIQGFVQLNGRLGKLSYMCGTGLSRQYYRQGDTRYDRIWLHPRLTLSMPIVSGLKLSYDFNGKPHASSLQNMSDIMIMTNDMEYTGGNPDMSMSRHDDHTVTLSYESPGLYTQLMTMYRHCASPMMRHTYRNESDKFITTFREGKRIDMLLLQSYTSYEIVQKYLTASVTAEMGHFENVGADYCHRLTAFNWSMSLNAYLGRWSLSASADNGFHFMENEYERKNTFGNFVNVSYRYKNLSLTLFWQNILQPEYSEEVENHNRYAHKIQTICSRDYANAVGFKLSWTISKGRKFTSPERDTNSLKDKDTGVAR